ncbi:TIM-barrel domain-containing protein [Vallitalea pronyensis]|nr:TIM-barrel domain-containing protein [Vallitalea pronyensis]
MVHFIKKIKSMLLILFMVTATLSFQNQPVYAYVTTLGDVTQVSVNGDTMVLTVDNGTEPGDDILEIQVCEDNILRVNYRPNGISPSPDTPMLDPNKTWDSVGATIHTASNPMTITTSDMIIEIGKTPCRMTVKKSDGTTLLWEDATGGVFSDGIRFRHSGSDNIYGIRSYDCFDSKGEIIRNDSNHAAHAGQQGDSGGPFMWSTAGYGVLVDSDGGYPYTNSEEGKLEFYYGDTPTEGRRYSKTDVEYFIMLGEPKEMMAAMSDITGHSPMLPKWSLGFSNFEWDMDQTEMVNMVDTYRAKNIPIDSYALDYDWKCYGEDNYGEFRWHTGRFPDASSTSLKTIMDNKGIKMIGITKPRIVTEDASQNRTQQYQDANQNDYWYPGHYEYQDYFIPVQVRSIDPYKSGARTWFWDHSKDAFDKGIVGWWNDETDKVSSNGASYWFGNFMTTHLSQAIYEGQRSYSDRRVWQTARTFYPGAQRYATTLWSGDIGIQFYKGEKVDWAAGMQEQLPVMLSSINNGQPKWGMDGGGFNQSDGTTANPTPELYAKWIQFGAFTPVFRVHGNNHQQRQPWFYGNTAEEVSKHAIQLRYSLLPYMYTYERSAYDTGLGLVRPLLFDYPNDQSVKNYTDGWMFGDWLMVSPVVEQGQNMKSIYLPAGTWYDYFRGDTYTGGQWLSYPVNGVSWTDIPLFVKEGAIIPTQAVQDYVDQQSIDQIDVDVFPSSTETSFDYYDDHGDNYQYESGEYFKQVLKAQDQGSQIRLKIMGKTGTYHKSTFTYMAKVHGKAASSVTLDGGNLTAYSSLSALEAASGNGYSVGKDIYGDVTYVKVNGGSSSDMTLLLTGNTSVTDTAYIYEAEEASLWGETVSTKAKVNNNYSGYSGTGFAEGFDQAGAATTFYVKVREGGDYPVTLQYANGTGVDKSLSIYVNGERIKSTHLNPLTGWDAWGSQVETLPLSSGNNMITYKYDNLASGNVNVDYIKVPFEPTLLKYEAENANLVGGVSINRNHSFYSGDGFVDSFTSAGAGATFTVQVPSAGNYNVQLRYANGTGSTKTLSTYVNGSDVATAQLSSPSQSWSEWHHYDQQLALVAGKNTIQYKYDGGDSGNVNVDRLVISAESIGLPESEKNQLDNGNFDRPIDMGDNWTEWHPVGQSVAYGIDAGIGMNPPEAAVTGNLRAYFHASSAYKQSIHQVVNVDNGTYKMQAFVRLVGASPYTARAEISNFGGAAKYYDLSVDSIWKCIEVDDIVVTNGQVDVGFYVDSPGGTVLQFDDVKLMKK